MALGATGAVIVALGIAVITSFFRQLTNQLSCSRTIPFRPDVEVWIHRFATIGSRAAFV